MNLSELLARVEVAIGIQGPPRALRDALEQEMRGHFLMVPIRAAEQAERFEERVRQRITEKQREMEAAGTTPVVIIHYANHRRVVGSCWVDPTDNQAIAAAKNGQIGRAHV